MAKKDVSEELKELRSKIQDGKVIIGLDRVIKAVKAKKIEKVFVSSNCPQKTVEDLQYYANLAGVEVAKLDFDNEELGVFCRKNFFISVLGVSA